MKRLLLGFCLVALAVAGRAYWWISPVPDGLLWLFYVAGTVFIVQHFFERERPRYWAGSVVMFALIALPRAISWMMHR